MTDEIPGPDILDVNGRLKGAFGDHDWQPRIGPMEELVGTILSQHTSDVNSGRAYRHLREVFSTWEELEHAPVSRIAEAVKSAGLSNLKAPRIQALVRAVRERAGGFDLLFLGTMPLAEAKRWLRELPGVGPKTAACVLLFALGRPALPVDTHVYRVAQRLGLIGPEVSPERAHDELEGRLPPAEVYNFHVNLIALGRRVCKAQRPLHEDCPLKEVCKYYLERRAASESATGPEPWR